MNYIVCTGCVVQCLRILWFSVRNHRVSIIILLSRVFPRLHSDLGLSFRYLQLSWVTLQSLLHIDIRVSCRFGLFRPFLRLLRQLYRNSRSLGPHWCLIRQTTWTKCRLLCILCPVYIEFQIRKLLIGWSSALVSGGDLSFLKDRRAVYCRNTMNFRPYKYTYQFSTAITMQSNSFSDVE